MSIGFRVCMTKGVGSVFFGTSYFLSHNPCWGYHLTFSCYNLESEALSPFDKNCNFLFFMCPPGIYSFALLRTQHWSHRPSTITCIPHLKRYSRRLCSRTLKETCVMLRWFSVFGCKDWMIISSWSKYLTVTVARVHSISCKGSWLSCCAELFQKFRCIKFWQTFSGLK